MKIRNRRRIWYGWRQEYWSWLNCREMCHEVGQRCWYWLHVPYAAIVGHRSLRQIVYSQLFVSQWLDMLWGASVSDKEQQ
jgi:hypothetical protein